MALSYPMRNIRLFIGGCLVGFSVNFAIFPRRQFSVGFCKQKLSTVSRPSRQSTPSFFYFLKKYCHKRLSYHPRVQSPHACQSPSRRHHRWERVTSTHHSFVSVFFTFKKKKISHPICFGYIFSVIIVNKYVKNMGKKR